MANAFLQQLRDETAACHRALEQIELSTTLMSPGVTLGDYTRYLERMYGFIRMFEMQVFPMLVETVPDLPQRIKTQVIIDDLQALDVNVDDTPLVNAQVIKALYPTIAAAMGGLYVVEGSTLGGVIINRHIREVLADQLPDGNRYFYFYGSETGSRWKAFLERLTNTAEETGLGADIIDAARQTFSCLEVWMRESPM